jgi:hypothetical protein
MRLFAVDRISKWEQERQTAVIQPNQVPNGVWRSLGGRDEGRNGPDEGEDDGESGERHVERDLEAREAVPEELELDDDGE